MYLVESVLKILLDEVLLFITGIEVALRVFLYHREILSIIINNLKLINMLKLCNLSKNK